MLRLALWRVDSRLANLACLRVQPLRAQGLAPLLYAHFAPKGVPVPAYQVVLKRVWGQEYCESRLHLGPLGAKNLRLRCTKQNTIHARQLFS